MPHRYLKNRVSDLPKIFLLLTESVTPVRSAWVWFVRFDGIKFFIKIKLYSDWFMVAWDITFSIGVLPFSNLDLKQLKVLYLNFKTNKML